MKFYKNPLPINNIGDPFILRASNGKYYCYPTSAPDEGFKVWVSNDLVDWEERGFAYKANKDSWGYNRFWAPEVMEYNGKYYMYYTAGWKANNSLRIGLAISKKPVGPYIDVNNKPLFDFRYAVIDANVLIDDDGKKYLYYSRDCSENIVNGCHESHIYGVELSNDMLKIKGSPVFLLKPEQQWEMKSGNEWRWNEGPFLMKRNNIYYLMYSANCYSTKDYSIGYAVSDNPLGPFKKYKKNPVLKSKCRKISGPGHNCVITSPDGSGLFIVYHTHVDPKIGGGNRQLCIDKMNFRKDGSIHIKGPTINKFHALYISSFYSFTE